MKIKLTIIFFLISNLACAQQWQLADGTLGNPVAAISIYRSDPDTMFALGAGFQFGPGLLRSTDGGNHWDSITVLGSDIGAVEVDPNNSKLLYISVFGADLESNDVYMSWDGGSTWKQLFYGRGSPAPVIEIDPADNKIVYVGVGPSFIYRTTDQGETWDTIPKHPEAYALTSLAIAPSNDSIIYAGYTTGIFKSIDRGNTWQTLNLGFGIHSGTLIAVNPKSPDTVYVAVFPTSNYLGGMYKSVNGGKNWQEANNGLSDKDRQIISMTINPKNPNQIFMGLYGNWGLQGNLFWRSTNGGESWTEYSSSLPVSGVVQSIKVDTASNRIFCGIYSSDNSHFSGLYFTDFTTDVRYPVISVPSNFHLSQNYPNPFNPGTIIKYSLTKEGCVQLIIFNALSQKIKELVNTLQKAGDYSIDFNASTLSSGIYFYQLRFDGLVQTKKMIIMR